MNVQVTVKIDRESIAEMAEVFKAIIGGSTVPQVSGQGIQQTQQPTSGAVPTTQSTPVTPSVPGAQPQTPQAAQSAQVTSPGPQTYSGQIAQRTQLPPEAITGGAAPTPGIPTTTMPQEYTQDQMAVAFTGLIDAGRRDVVTQILAAFGVQALTQIPKERYPELALKLREAGANI